MGLGYVRCAMGEDVLAAPYEIEVAGERFAAEASLKPLYDPKREQEIYESLREVNDGPLFDDNLREIWDVLLHVMKEL